ncbi:hypothetical protein [Streptomyces sp. NPDC088350]|uniref:hypothetical protein n=1 Tax=Streptomyces sp. NPDC088350 TaxID=3365854 RepID=UPI0037FA6F34
MVRLLALAGVAVCAVALPLAVASAGPVRDEGHAVVRSLVHSSDSSGSSDGDAKEASAAPSPARSPLTLGLGLATAARCGPELSSPDGVEAQTCVMTQGEDTWARTYYRNATGDDLDAVLSLMGPADRTVQMHCAVAAEDEPALCETPRERTQGDLAAYTAVAEFAARSGSGPLLLRSGSNSSAPTAS